jgi:serine/threonine-protein kinase
MKPVHFVSEAAQAPAHDTREPEAVAPEASPHAGQLVGDRYRLEEPLERGAMGSIWRAEHVRLRAPVAVKFLDPSLIGDSEMRDRFMQEARSAAAVRSAHVVQVFDYGIERGIPYLAMELLEGENLDTRLTARGTLTAAELNKIFTEVARGIGKAHAMGVVHRDLKPGNIFIAREGEYEITKLVDFGIAKVDAGALKFTQIVGTQLGTLLGTPQYMSPEQVRGSSSVDYRTDLWALAIIACECLTGRCPFPGTTLGDLTIQICTEKPRAPSALGEVPAGFDQWFFKATRKRASKRFASVEEMTAALSQILDTGSVLSVPNRVAALRARSLGLPSPSVVSSALAAFVVGLRQLFARLTYPLLRWLDPFSRVDSEAATTQKLPPSADTLARVDSKRAPAWNLLSQRRLIGYSLLALVCGLVLVGRSERGARGNLADHLEAAHLEQSTVVQSAATAPAYVATEATPSASAREASVPRVPELPKASGESVGTSPGIERRASEPMTEMAGSQPAAPARQGPVDRRTVTRPTPASGARSVAAVDHRAQPSKASARAAPAATAPPKAEPVAAPKRSASGDHPFDDRI